MEDKTPYFEKKSGQDRNLIIKTIRKKVVSKATSK